jgi:catechol 2,3-dioxygenase-like lactoylglutathione lyase family enzyme
MQLRLSRIILFTANMDLMVAFYRDVLGFKLKANDKGLENLRCRRLRDRCIAAAASQARSSRFSSRQGRGGDARSADRARGEDGQGIQHGRARPRR